VHGTETEDWRGGAHWPCALDKRCSRFSDALAVDTSHVCVLVRAARLLEDDARTLADRFVELLRAHSCAGQHRLISSRALLAADTEMNLSSPTCAPLIYGYLPPGALDLLESVDGGSGNDLPEGSLGDRDRTLAAAALVVADGGRETVIVVTDDEALADWIRELAAAMGDAEVAILPAPSIELLSQMHACGAVGYCTSPSTRSLWHLGPL
jgi:alkanesulfonate monooxygenase SsuD/methylene tetrahydromethanopterin reductase-like flavin-dependent oxidoreductase (luciferase family)